MKIYHVYWMILFLGYVRPNTYKLIWQGSSWHDSRTACINDGMDLAVISENNVFSEIRNFLNYNSFSKDIWIGLTWSVNRSNFLWVNEKHMSWPADQIPWASKEPNCHIYKCKEETTLHTCVRMSCNNSSGWEMRTHACHQRHSAICQKLSSTTRSATSETVKTNCSITVNSTTIDSPTTSNSVTINLNKTVKSTKTNSPTSTGSTVQETSPESTKTQSQTQLTTYSATTILSANSKLISTMESTEIPRIVTTEYITNGTFFNNCTKKCRCKSLANEMNAPNENYRIDKRQTSAYIRRHSSAYDGRLSSRIIGYTGASIICGVVLVVISFDIINLMKRNEANK